MISIIICSLHEKITESLVNNIESTIGIEHEIIFINNQKNQFSIFQAYNIGVSKAKYPICCFMHDDIIYHSNNWGYILSQYFQNNVNLGIVAVAGCKYLRKIPSFWAISQYNAFNIIQSNKKITVQRKFGIISQNPKTLLLLMECGFAYENPYSILSNLTKKPTMDFTFMIWILLCKLTLQIFKFKLYQTYLLNILH
jgi:hypothetical protein